jgi:hypothetical protein
MHSNSHRIVATTPQPRKPNHVIIADAITTARMQIVTFRPIRDADDPDLFDGSRNSTCCFTVG